MKQYVTRSRRQRGFGSTVLVVVVLGVLAVGVGAMTLTMSAYQNSNRSAEKYQATALAEAGVQDLYNRIRRQMQTSGDFPFTLDSVELDHNQVAGHSAGTYSARVVNWSNSTEDVNYDGRVRRVTYKFEIEGLGTSVTGIASKVRTKFTGQVDFNLKKITTTTKIGDAPAQIYYPKAAMSTNGQLNIQNSAGMEVGAPGGQAHLLANDGMKWDPHGSAKETFGSAAVLKVQGQIAVARDAYDFTVSSNGLGNGNGEKNYTTDSAAASMPDNTILYSGSRIAFADSGVVSTWQTRWRTTASVKVTPTSVSTSSMTPDASGNKVIEAPSYIEGDLTINSGDILKLKPTSTNPSRNIIYVNGKVTNAGALQNLGVKIVVVDKYSESASGSYGVATAGSIFSNQTRVLQNSGLLVLGEGKDAVRIQSGATTTSGLIYAMRGGIDIDADSKQISGLLVSGGSGNDGGIDIKMSKTGKFKLIYTPEAAIPGDIAAGDLEKIDVTYEINGVRSPFNATRMTEWVELDKAGKVVNTFTKG
ncbi:MAG: hypothetical protein JNM85_07575 [Chthonomonas sp.]|nr:hypothetical protein [Chthonomonas sp.]